MTAARKLGCLHPGCRDEAAVGSLCVRHAGASLRKSLVRRTVLPARPDPIETASRALAEELDLHDVPVPDATLARRERVGGAVASAARTVAVMARAVADARSPDDTRRAVAQLWRALDTLSGTTVALGDVLADVEEEHPEQVLRRQGGGL